MEFAMHDQMDIAKVTLKELLSASKTKALLSNILGNGVLEEYKGSKKKVVIVKGTTVQIIILVVVHIHTYTTDV